MENYTVQAGDTLNKIAQRFGYSDYKKAGLTAKSGNPNLIRPGEVYSINPAATSPARDNFTSSLLNDPNYRSPGQIEDDAEMARQKGTGAGTTTVDDPFSTYRSYLSDYGKSLTEDPDVAKSRTRLANIQNEIDERDLASRREYESLLDKSGGTVAGAEKSAAMSRRRSNSELADLAVRESGAARTYSALSGGQTARQEFLKTQADLAKPFQIGDTYYDPVTGKAIPNAKTPDPFELSPGQVRYSYDPATGEYKEVARLAPLPKEPTKLTETEKKNIMVGEVNEAVSQLGQIVKTKGFKGISPDDYNTMRAYLQETYGYEGVAELDKAIATLGLFVDNSGN